MPRLLSRYILMELLRVFLLTTAVLVIVIAFGAMVKPLAGDRLLTAAQAAKYLLLTIVPMLQFALPFSAGFASTLVLHRLASDNEILAAAVSGVSYPRILLPIAALGGVLAVIMVVLTQTLIPQFWGLARETIATDIVKMFQLSIEQGRPFTKGNMQIYADLRPEVIDRPEGTDAEQRFILRGVAAIETDGDKRIIADVTARQAVMDVYRYMGQRYLMLAMTDTVYYNARSGELAVLPSIRPKAVPVPDAIADKPQFMTRSQLLALRENPDAYAGVERHRTALAAAMNEVEAQREISDVLRQKGLVNLSGPAGADTVYTVEADRLVGGVLSGREGSRVRVTQIEGRTPIKRFEGASATVTVDSISVPNELAITIDLTDINVVDLRPGGSTNRVARASMDGLTLPGLEAKSYEGVTSAELIATAVAMKNKPETVGREINRLQRELRELAWDIESRLQNRYALSLTAPLLLVLGATLAMWLRRSQPLAVYVWAFLPSLLDLLLISSGQQMIKGGQLMLGSIVMWSGTAILLAILAWAFSRLIRH